MNFAGATVTGGDFSKNLLNENVENRGEETNVIGILIFKVPTKLTNNSCHESALFAMFRVI